jgi:hypothetical protein
MCREKVNVIHLHGDGQRRVAKYLHTNAIRAIEVPGIRVFTLIEFEIGGLPFGPPGRPVFHDKSEMIHDGAGRRPTRFALPQHDENAQEFDQRQRAILDHRSSQHGGPKLLLGGDVFHRKMDVPHRNAGVIRGRELRWRGVAKRTRAARIRRFTAIHSIKNQLDLEHCGAGTERHESRTTRHFEQEEARVVYQILE